MASSYDKLKELNLSRDEVDRIGEALKKPEFRKLLTDYVEEIQDPKNKQIYEDEIIQLEKERGVDVTFIHPNPGYVIKTSVNDTHKAFINICINDHINKPSSSPTVREGAKGLSWSLPHSLSPPREDLDNKRVRCQVFDIIFHSDTLHLASKNKAFRDMVNTTALDAVESNFDVQLDKKNLKFPKLVYKGTPRASIIRKQSDSKPDHTPEEKEIYDKIFAQVPSSPVRKPKKISRKNSLEDKSIYTTPKYLIKHRSHVDIQDFTEHRDCKMNVAIPKELIIEINLPLLKSSGDITLDVTEKTVQLISENPAKYKLNLTLPYQVNESSGSAKFDKDLKKLVIMLPVKRNTSVSDFSDSGVESDHYFPGSPESEEECVLKSLLTEQEPSEKHEASKKRPEEKCDLECEQFRTKFLEEGFHYNLPEFTCHVFENTIAFTLNVKNVDEKSVGKAFDDAGSSVHVKFTSIGASFYPSHYAFLVQMPSYGIDDVNTTVEVWDNNVILQVPVKCDKPLRSYFYGIDAQTLVEKFVEEPEIINNVFLESSKESIPQDEVNSQKQVEDQKFKTVDLTSEIQNQSHAIDIFGTSCESSGDELSYSSYSPRKSKGILKRLASHRFTVGRSISESSLDDFVGCPSSYENFHVSLDSVVPEDGEISTSLKKTVRFNDVVTRQLFRCNSSILGQKKKNQRKSQKKKRASERRLSESEASEVDEKREGELSDGQDKENDNQVKAMKKEDSDIFQLDIDS